MAIISMKHLLEAGVHFGHQTRRWNPKMKKYIFAERNSIYIIDLQKTVKMIQKAYKFAKETAQAGGTILFVGTKKQAQETVREEALRCEMPYVNQRWLGGMLTNYETIRKRIDYLKRIEMEKETGTWLLRPKKERAKIEKQRLKLEKYLGGIKDMDRLPDALYVIDPKKEEIAVLEARKLKIPVIGIVDTNCDPDLVDYVIPGNDDAIRAIKLLTLTIANAVLEGKQGRQFELSGDQVTDVAHTLEGPSKVEPGAEKREFVESVMDDSEDIFEDDDENLNL